MLIRAMIGLRVGWRDDRGGNGDLGIRICACLCCTYVSLASQCLPHPNRQIAPCRSVNHQRDSQGATSA